MALTSYAEVFDDLSEEISDIAISKGFWDYVWITDDGLKIPLKIALIHTELSEALEVHRKFYDDGEPSSISGMTPAQEQDFTEEMMDAVIRIFDVIGYYGLGEDAGDILIAKIEKNRERPHLHGKRY